MRISCFSNSNALGMVSVSSIIRCTIILLLFGFAVQCEEVGLGKHNLVNGEIDQLKVNTRIAESVSDLEPYRMLKGACDVTMDNDGNITLWYTKDSNTTENGCSLDLVTKNESQILLKFGISHFGNLTGCITQKGGAAPDNIISFSYSMKSDEFEQIKDGPKIGKDSDCSDDNKCKNDGGDCMNTMAFYSIGWMPTVIAKITGKSSLPNQFAYFLQPVGDHMSRSFEPEVKQNETFKLMIKGLEFCFASIDKEEFFILTTNCYKEEKLQKAEEWKIVDTNYNNINKENFTHLFTFHVMPIKAMRESMQNIWAKCKENPSNPGCVKDAKFQKCDKMFIRFEKEHFRMLVPDTPTTVQTSTITTQSATTDDDEYIDYEDKTTKGNKNNRKTTEASGMGTIMIVIITLGILIFVTIIIGLLIWFFVFRSKDKNEEEEKPDEQQEYPPTTTTTTTKAASTIGEKKETKKDPSTVVETQIDRAEVLNDPSTVVGTQLDINVKAGSEVPDTVADETSQHKHLGINPPFCHFSVFLEGYSGQIRESVVAAIIYIK
uniref:CUB domain-containing protein n=1 Tax=Meloidogyne hapla TaxID=6305 RepID=A0A1I8C2R4_MELHA